MTESERHLFNHDVTKLEEGVTWLIGVDEVGRGPLAGPVHAGAVAIHRDWFADNRKYPVFAQVNDSKKLSAAKRELIYDRLLAELYPGGLVQCAVCYSNVKEIDRLNILEATKLAMYRALKELEGRLSGVPCPFPRSEDIMYELDSSGRCSRNSTVRILIDGRPLKGFPFAHDAIVKGDATSFTIALASIAAKVERDAWMMDCDEEDTRFGWKKNKGYGTAAHCEALKTYGPTRHHRSTFIGKILGAN